MQMGVFSGVLSLFLFAVICHSAPVGKSSVEELSDLLQKTQNQETDLKQLLPFSNQENAHSQSFVHSESKVLTNINGVQQGDESSEHFAQKDGQLVSDVKQKTHIDEDEEGKPHKVVETNVDIPAKNIHEAFINDDAQEANDEGEEEAYREALREAYNQMLAEELLGDQLFEAGAIPSTEFDPELSENADKRSFLDEQPAYDDGDEYPFNTIQPEALNSEQVNYIYDIFANPGVDSSNKNAIYAWLLNGLENGDQTAQVIISNIANIVSDNEAQEEEEYVKEQLEEIIAQSILDNLDSYENSESDSEDQASNQMPSDQTIRQQNSSENTEQETEQVSQETKPQPPAEESSEEKSEEVDSTSKTKES